MKLKKIISGFLAFSLAISCTAIMPKTALASTATVSQTIFELEIEAMVAGEIPEGTILNSDILDSANSSNENGLISNKVTKETEFLKIFSKSWHLLAPFGTFWHLFLVYNALVRMKQRL